MNLWFAGHIRQTGFKQDLHLGLGNYKIDAGLQTALMNVKSAEWKKVTLEEKEQRKAWDNAIWANLVFPLNKNIHVSAGLQEHTRLCWSATDGLHAPRRLALLRHRPQW